MAKVKEILSTGGDVHYRFDCPGCGHSHVIDKRWAFNNDFNKPTFSPSYLRHEVPGSYRCHSFINDGFIQFLGDCTHGLAGQTVELPEIEGGLKL